MISNAKRRTESKPLLKKLEILNVKQIHIFKVQDYMFKFLNNKLPSLFNTMFIYNSSIHSYCTRQHSNFHLPKCKTDLRLNSFRYTSVKIYNELVNLLNYKKKSFKKSLKIYLIERM